MGEQDPLAGREALVRKILDDEESIPKQFNDIAILFMAIGWILLCIGVFFLGLRCFNKHCCPVKEKDED